MNILFDLGHPAHLHLFRNFIEYLNEKNHNVTIVTRDKDVLNSLLDHYGFDYTSISKPKKGMFNMFIELIKRDVEIIKLHKKIGFDLAFGTSVSIAHLSVLSGCKSYNFNEDDDGVSKYYEILTYPFTTRIVSPISAISDAYPKKRDHHNSYHELAYLHPDNFKADESVLKKYKLKKHEYIIIRKSALKASHDIGARGLENTVWEEVMELTGSYDQVLSMETAKTHQIDPWDMHHVMAFAKMLISDSQTMTVEAAVLGVPSVRMSSFVGRSAILDELADKYELTYGFLPHDEQGMISKVKELLEMKNLEKEWEKRKKKMLSEKEDLNKWMIDYFEKIKS